MKIKTPQEYLDAEIRTQELEHILGLELGQEERMQASAELEEVTQARQAWVNRCQCIDCFGDKPKHSPDCVYMKEMFGGDR